MSTRVITIAITVALLLGACSSGEPTDQIAAQPAVVAPAVAAEPAATAATPGAVHVLAGSTELGDLLAGPDGRTLYGFTNDTEAASTCYGTCADAWPPVIVPADWAAGPGLDFGIFATTVRDDGQLQLVAGKWPLYYFAGDAAPGDVNGQASGDVWFAVDLDGRLITDAAPAAAAAEAGDGVAGQQEVEPSGPVATATTELGVTLVDGDGLTLYGFTNDTEGVPSCYDACADAWPPLLVDSALFDSAETPAGLDPAVFSTVQRDDGTTQLVAGAWPLYRFAGDSAPGDVNGQGSGGVWFAVDPNGRLITGDESAASVTVDSETATVTVTAGGYGGAYGGNGS